MRLLKRLLMILEYSLLVLGWLALIAYFVSVIFAFLALKKLGPQWWQVDPQTIWTIFIPGFLRGYFTSPLTEVIAAVAAVAAFVCALILCVWATLILITGTPPVLKERDPGAGPILISDSLKEALKHDPLGYHELAKSIANTIMRSADSAPFAIAIEGRWGVGKTTLMQSIKCELTNKRFPAGALGGNGKPQQWTAFTVWFNPWRHRKRDAQKAFMSAVFEDIPWRAMDWFRSPLMRRRIISQVANTLSFIRGGNSMGARLSNKLDVQSDYRNKFQSEFEGFLRYWSQKDGKTQVVMVIFIDDLDRCAPTDIAPILEAMKLFLESKRCIFVLGFDPKVVAQSIQREYRGVVPDGLKYLEKLIQVEFPLFQSRDDQLKRLLESYIDSAHLGDEFAIIQKAVPDYIDLLLRYTHRTPRAIKRVINSMAIMTSLHQPSEYVDIFYLLLLQARWRDPYERICEEFQENVAQRRKEILHAISQLERKDEAEKVADG